MQAETRPAIARSGAPGVPSGNRTVAAAVGRGSAGRRGPVLSAPEREHGRASGAARRIAPYQLDCACVANRSGGAGEALDPRGTAHVQREAERRPARGRGACGQSYERGAEHPAGEFGGVGFLAERGGASGMNEPAPTGIQHRSVVADAENRPPAPDGGLAEAACDEFELVHRLAAPRVRRLPGTAQDEVPRTRGRRQSRRRA